MIKVFNATDKNYATHGDLILQPSKAVVHKEDNGEFYLDLETPLNEKEYKNTTPEAGQTAEGTSFSINVDTTKQYQVQTLKGQTTQTGTPTPTTPQPINITTGRQVVSVCGKNLLDISKVQTGKLVGTTLNAPLSLVSVGTWDTIVQYIPVQYGKTYTFSKSEATNGQFVFAEFDNNLNMVARETKSLYSVRYLTYTISQSSTKYLIVGYRNDYSHNDLQVEESSTATTYEEYKGNDYEINLGKNLANIENIQIGKSWSNVANTNRATILFIPVIAGQQYSLVSSYTNENITQIRGVLNKGANDQVSSLVVNGTFTVASGWSYISIEVIANTTFTSSMLDGVQIMLCKGSATINDYTPYKTPIELCKIGDYQDKIYKQNGNWYIYKEIGRVVLNGSESWTLDSTNSRFYNINYISDYMVNQRTNAITNYYRYGDSASDGYFALSGSNNYLFIHFPNSSTNTVALFKTWLGGHNVEVYYVLNTPTNTLIEDEELINQLESIRLLSGLNNVSVSSADLPAILQLKYNFTTAYSNVIKYIDYLVPNNILVANTPQGDQAFRITNIEKTRRKIKLKANHVFYDSMNYLIADSYVVDKNCNDALDHLNNATSDLSPFTTISNITSINSYRCVRKSLYEAIQVVLERWGGHLVRNDWTLGIYDTIGQDNGVTIRYAKNLKDISATYDWQDVVTKLLPVGKDGILLNEINPDASIYVESATQYDIPYTKTVSFDQNNIAEDDYKDEEGTLDEDAYKQALVDDLYSKAMEYITNNYLPKVNYKLSANVEKVSDVGDRVEVIDEKLGINLMTNIISFDYDCILERYTQIEFGNFTPTLSNLMTQISVHTEEQINSSTQTLQITLNQELTDATDKIWNALGNSYVIYEGDKILVVDTLPKEEATNVIMINNGGIAFSNSGIDGTFSSAWTIDNVLNMEQINVINLTADLIKGGTLKLGSNLNQNGRLEVFDEANSLIAELNKDGLKMYGNDGSYVLMNNQVGFSGFDRNDNKIYWVDKDVFHQKKSEVEEEITLVKKMRIIPITIRDNNNQIVNDGIGFVNVGGGV